MKARPKRTKAIRYRPPHKRTRSNTTIIIKAIQNCLIITLCFLVVSYLRLQRYFGGLTVYVKRVKISKLS